jgi:O-antigen/teichoic acid export membrane protein
MRTADRAATDRVIGGSVILLLATTFANACNYMFQFSMSRILTPPEFGTMNALLALAMIIMAPGNIILMAVARDVSEMKAAEQLFRLRAFFLRTRAVVGLVAGAVFAVFLLANNVVGGYLNLDSAMPVIVTSGILLSSLMVPVNLGILQGLQAFMVFGAHIGLTGLVRLLSGLALVFVGLGVNGALAATIVANALVLGSSGLWLWRRMPAGSEAGRAPGTANPRRLAAIAVGVTGFAALTNLDVVLVKHFFPAETAADYAAVSVLGRAMLYLPVAVAMALFPLVSEMHALGRDSFRVLVRSAALTAALAAGALGVFFFFPEFLITVLMGEKYRHAAPLVPWFGMAMAPYTLVYLFMNFHLARSRTFFLAPLLVGCVALVGLVYGWFHGTLREVVGLVAAVGGAILLINIVQIAREVRSSGFAR